jgi:hypothetical protein
MIISSFFSHFLATRLFVTLPDTSKFDNRSTVNPRELLSQRTISRQSLNLSARRRAAVLRNSFQMLSKAPKIYKSANGRWYLVRCSLTATEEWQYLYCLRYALWRCWTGNAWCRRQPWRRGTDPGANMLSMAIIQRTGIRRQIIDSFKISFTLKLWCHSWTVCCLSI